MIRGLLLLALAVPASAGFELSGVSARAISMGSAFTAVGDDAAGMAFNPANTGQVSDPQAQVSYLRQRHVPGGVTDAHHIGVAGVFPVRQELLRGGVGVQWAYEDKPHIAGRLMGFNYGTRGLFEWEEAGLELGANAKFLSQGGGLKPDIDLGVLGRVGDRVRWGVSILNANRPKLDPDDRAPATIRAGVSEQVRGFTLALDVMKSEPSFGRRGLATVGAGMERWWPSARRGALAGRAGLLLGDRTRTFNWGAGWRLMGGQLDYSMTIPMKGVAVIGHAVTMLLRFGASDPEREYERMLTLEISYRRDLTQALEAGEVKQWKLGEELRKLREEMELLRDQLVDKTASEAEARARLRELEQRRREAAAQFERLQAERAKTRETLFKEDWAAYQRLKQSGSPDAVLLDNVRRILREYKDAGVDLSAANQELVRLLRAQPGK